MSEREPVPQASSMAQDAFFGISLGAVTSTDNARLSSIPNTPGILQRQALVRFHIPDAKNLIIRNSD